MIRNIAFGFICVALLTGCNLFGTPDDSNGEQNGPDSISIEEVAKHKREDDCWEAIDGKVYDITDYISEHPGGVQSIIGPCGTEATGAWDGINGGKGHSPTADRLLEEYYVGELEQ
ncbi:MAG: cytochrome b5 domain-containing protein [Candidatus Dojkabacteria bacterium]